MPPKDFKRITEQEYTTVNGVDEARQAVKEHRVQGVDVIKILGFGNLLKLEQDEVKTIVETA